MINHEVTDDLMFVVSFIFSRNFVYLITSSIAIYFAWQKMTRKIYASFIVSMDRIYDEHISSLIISNKRDNTITILSIRYMMEDGNDIELVNYVEPLIIKPYDTQRIETGKYSYLLDSSSNKFTPKFPPLGNGYVYMIDISGKIIKCSTKLESTPRMAKISKFTSTFNGIVLTSKVKYIFTYRIGDKERNLLIDNNGYIHRDPQHGDMPFYFNSLSGDYVENIKHGLINGYHNHFDSYMLIYVKDLKSQEIVFKKSDIELMNNNQ